MQAPLVTAFDPFLGSASDVTFSLERTDSAGMQYFTAESPQGDLIGRPTLKVGSSRTNAGIVGRTMHLTVPMWDGTKYNGSVQARIVLNAPIGINLDKSANVLRSLLGFIHIAGTVEQTATVGGESILDLFNECR